MGRPNPTHLTALCSLAILVTALLIAVISHVFYGKNCDVLMVGFLTVVTTIEVKGFDLPTISDVIRASSSTVVVILLHAICEFVFKFVDGKEKLK